jgi:predicted glutamine amidotransferase
MHVFAHNGDLDRARLHASLAPGCERPVGESDSEYAFCALLARMRAAWTGAGPPPIEERLGLLTAFAAELRALGPANFLYADGDAVFAHGHERTQPGGAHRTARPAHARAAVRPGGRLLRRGGAVVVPRTSLPARDSDARALEPHSSR